MQRLFAAVLAVACFVGSTPLLAATALILALAIPAVATRCAPSVRKSTRPEL